MQISVQLPNYMQAVVHGLVEPRNTLRNMVAGRSRRLMNQAVADMAQRTKYRKIADDFKVQQITTGDSINVSLINTNAASQYLLGELGVVPHIIHQEPHLIPIEVLLERLKDYVGFTPAGLLGFARAIQGIIARRGVNIPHPGLDPDYGVLIALMRLEHDLYDNISAGYAAWCDKFGNEEAWAARFSGAPRGE